MRTSAIVALVAGLGLTAAPELVYPGGGAVFAQGKSGEVHGNNGNRGRSGRSDDTTLASRGNSGNQGGKGDDWMPPGQAAKLGAEGSTAKGGKSDEWMPPGQAAKLGEDGETLKGGKANGRYASAEGLEDIDGIETELEDTPKGRGHIASALGALNAAHANENALANASPNSRVGRIAAYRDEVLNGQAAEEELEAAQTLLDSLEEPDRNLRQIARELRDVQNQLEEAEPGSQQEADLRLERRQLAREFRDARTYRQAERAVEDLTEEVEASEELQMELLEAAANKEVTDEVVAEVNRLLGIEDLEEPAALVDTTADDGGDDELLLLPEES